MCFWVLRPCRTLQWPRVAFSTLGLWRCSEGSGRVSLCSNTPELPPGPWPRGRALLSSVLLANVAHVASTLHSFLARERKTPSTLGHVLYLESQSCSTCAQRSQISFLQIAPQLLALVLPSEGSSPAGPPHFTLGVPPHSLNSSLHHQLRNKMMQINQANKCLETIGGSWSHMSDFCLGLAGSATMKGLSP